MAKANSLVTLIDRKLDVNQFREQHWEGTFWEYLDLVQENPSVARMSRRLYDMILQYGSEPYTQFKQEYIRYHFFGDPLDHGADAIFGLERPLMQLVDFLKSASQGYGTERRILLLHGPVGSSKSTIARLLTKVNYRAPMRASAGSYTWRLGKGERRVTPIRANSISIARCTKSQHTIHEARKDVLDSINEKLPDGRKIRLYGEACPFCRKIQSELMDMYSGDWKKVMEHVKVKRLILSEKDRRGIGTFQPKDEKNQDSTELTGDINYRKIAEYGSDSDPRAFNFDGELNIANRGIVEFIEVLKLDVAFLATCWARSQEHLTAEEVCPDVH